MMLSHPLNKRITNPITTFVWLITGYVVILTFASLLQSGLLKGVSYISAFGIFMLMAAMTLFQSRNNSNYLGFGLALSLYYYGMVGSIAYNFHQLDWAVALKMIMGPLFIIFGASFENRSRDLIWSNKNIRTLFVVLIVLPLGLWLLQLIMGKVTFGSEGAVSIFANRNNAALYAVTLIALYNVLSGKSVKNFFIYVLGGLSFGTLGVFLAILLAMLICIAKNSRVVKFGVLFVFSIIGVSYYISPEIGIISRFTPVIDSLKFIATGQINLGVVTYADLVRMLHSSDLSFIFRLKHWFDLLGIYANGSFYDWIFGLGVGSSVRMSEMHLVPHNDYLRYLFECGIVTFLGFILVIALIAYHCGRRWDSVPLFVVAIYFVSENLIDNFVAMAMFYFCAGVLTQRIHFEIKAKE